MHYTGPIFTASSRTGAPTTDPVHRVTCLSVRPSPGSTTDLTNMETNTNLPIMVKLGMDIVEVGTTLS